MYHVYQIVEKATRQPVYVGCTSRLEARAKWHRERGNLTVERGLAVHFSTPNHTQAACKEQEMIRELKSAGVALLNKSDRKQGRKGTHIPTVVYVVRNPNGVFLNKRELAKYLGCTVSTVNSDLSPSYRNRCLSFKTWKPVWVERMRLVPDEQPQQSTSAR